MLESLKVEVTEIDYHTFLDISVHLTGFNKNELLATGMAETYYYTIMKEPDQDNVRAFFKESQKIMDEFGHDETQLNGQICYRLIPASRYFEIAKRIILVWYTGIWTSIVERNGKQIKTSEMISERSYAEGLIWSAAETHPAGTKQAGYGSWAIAPLTPEYSEPKQNLNPL